MPKINICDLKANLSKYLRQVEHGATIIITRQSKPIGRIIPEVVSLEERMQTLVSGGLLSWSGSKLPIREPVAIKTPNSFGGNAPIIPKIECPKKNIKSPWLNHFSMVKSSIEPEIAMSKGGPL